MAQPGSFPNPNQRQRPAQFQSPAGFNSAPQFATQPAGPQRAQRGPAHTFYQKPAAPAQNDAFFNQQPQSDGFFNQQQAPAFSQDFQQAGSVPAQQFQTAPAGFQHRHPGHGDNFGYAQQTPPHSNPRQPMQQPPRSNPGQAGQPDFMNQFSSNPMAGLAMNSAQDFLHKQSELYLPGAYGMWGNLKYYFTVNNSYVKSRLKILLLPFRHKNWRRMGNGEQDESKPMQYAPPTRDCNAPDLYIPLMGFLTYILIVGYCKGTSNQFSPDVITKDASYCLVMQLIEIGVLAACLYVLNSSISFLDLVSFSGYKYIPLVINTVVFQLLGSVAYYVSLLYTGVAVSYFTLNCMKGSVADPTPENRLFRNYLLFGVSCLQLVLVCWISYTTAPTE